MVILIKSIGVSKIGGNNPDNLLTAPQGRQQDGAGFDLFLPRPRPIARLYQGIIDDERFATLIDPTG
ncbi:MAG: hypothetical protein U0401_16980 [Anaerolineae bacterium]